MNNENKNGSVRSTDMLAKEAIEHIRNTPLDQLRNFVPEDEDRVTVLRAWQEKQEEKEEEFYDFYSKLRHRINKNFEGWEEKSRGRVYQQLTRQLLFLPDSFYLMVKLLFDKDVPASNKGALLAGILYVMSPIDIFPDFIAIVGWVDDLVVAVLALNKYLDTNNTIINQKIDDYWLNDEDFFKTFKHLLDVADESIEFLPRKFFQIVQGILKSGKNYPEEPKNE